jgi:hypothetical protein
VAASYHKVYRLFWKDPKVRGWLRAGEDRTVFLALYMLTCDHKNSEGLYYLPKDYVGADLGWEADAVGERMAHLLDKRFIEYDEDAEVVFVCNALKYHEPKSKLQLKGAISALEQVPPTPLLTSFLTAAETHAQTLAKEIRKTFKDRLPK